jgi:hypothetical protein
MMFRVFGVPLASIGAVRPRSGCALRPPPVRLVVRLLPPVRKEPDEVVTLTLDQIEVKSYVGGLVRSFERHAA